MGLLKGLHPLLTADLLHALRSMGHGDELVLADANFPAASIAKSTHTGSVVMLAGANTTDALEAICSVMPLDFFVDYAVFRMAPNNGDLLPPEAQEVHAAAQGVIGRHSSMELRQLERFDFYDRAKQAFVVVQAAAERRPYGCFILKKGVVGPDGQDLKP